MKVMIDTNIIISAILFPNGRAAEALKKALVQPYQPIVCDYIVDELYRKFQEKFPNKSAELKAFLNMSLSIIRLVNTPKEDNELEKNIRDVKDRPIFRAAYSADVDLLLTGDKDFLEASIKRPRVISAADFIALRQGDC